MRSGIHMLAPAKVNLLLSVGPRRQDGYHDVVTVLQAITLRDQLSVSPAPDITVHCSDARIGGGPGNLAWRAADALRRASAVRRGAAIRILKAIPAEAGLGGGSADAAAVLVACNQLWELHWTPERLATVAAALGADVPFFLVGGTALGEGRGDRITRLDPLPPLPLVVARPTDGSSTAAAYAALDALGAWARPAAEPLLAAIGGSWRDGRGGRRAALGQLLGNSFEEAILPLRPDIVELRERLVAEGGLAALLCGSGSAVWALAPSLRWAGEVARRLRADGWWAMTARFSAQGVGPAAGA